MFEMQLNENTDFVMDKVLSDYEKPEREAEIPMMILAPTIINDERKLYISPLPVSYLARPSRRARHHTIGEIEGIDFGKFFEKQDGYNLKFTTALRMNATFPYILPNVFLPANPMIEVMDAGIRDNFGVETPTKFITNFKDWILENTSGVVIILLRGHEKFREIRDHEQQSIFSKLFNPVGNLYYNWSEIQDFQHDLLLDVADQTIDGNLEVIIFEYSAKEKGERASLNFHLTRKEKEDIQNSLYNDRNLEGFKKLETMFAK
jgi:hypothetical protein